MTHGICRKQVQLHEITEAATLLVTLVPGAPAVLCVRLSLRLEMHAEPQPVLWQILPREAAENLVCLLRLAMPEWNRVIKAEMAAAQSRPAF